MDPQSSNWLALFWFSLSESEVIPLVYVYLLFKGYFLFHVFLFLFLFPSLVFWEGGLHCIVDFCMIILANLNYLR